MSWYHDALMESYYSAREAQMREAESFSLGYDTELAEFYAANERVTFKRWLSEFSEAMGYQEECAA